MSIRLFYGIALLTVAVTANGVWRRQNNDRLKAEIECGHKPADIVFVLDESGSIWGPHFVKQLEFVKGVTDYMDVSFNQTRIAVETFSDEYRPHFQLGEVVGDKDLHANIDEIQQMRGGTKTFLALKYMTDVMFAKDKIRSWVPQIAIVITDGESEDPKKTEKEARKAKEKGIQVFAIGVGHSIDPEELEAIASDPTHVFSVDNFDALMEIQIKLAIKTCEVTTIPPPSTTTTTTTTTTPAPTTTLPQYIQGCRGRFAPDIMFSIPDELGIADTELSIDFIKGVVSEMAIGPLMTRAGLAPRKCETAKGIRLKDHDTAAAINSALDRRYLQGAAIDRQLEYMSTKAFEVNFGGRPDAARFAVMILDNRADDAKATLDAALVAQEKMDIFIIGVGDFVDRDEALQIASADEFAIFVDSFSEISTVQDELITKICQSLNSDGFSNEF